MRVTDAKGERSVLARELRRPKADPAMGSADSTVHIVPHIEHEVIRSRGHQQTREGRLDHRDRQRAYRERRGTTKKFNAGGGGDTVHAATSTTG